jgi:hypothetical protein
LWLAEFREPTGIWTHSALSGYPWKHACFSVSFCLMPLMRFTACYVVALALSVERVCVSRRSFLDAFSA